MYICNPIPNINFDCPSKHSVIKAFKYPVWNILSTILNK